MGNDRRHGLYGNSQETTDTVFCLDAESGEELWKFSYPCKTYGTQHEGGPSATPALDADTVYIVSKGAQVFCLDLATGAKRWERAFTDTLQKLNAGYGVSASPIVGTDALFVNAGNAYALNKATGETIWTTPYLDEAFASPMLFDFKGTPALLCFNMGGVFIFKQSDGTQLAHFKSDWHGGLCGASPIVTGNKILLTCGGGIQLLEVGDDLQIKELYKLETLRNQQITPILFGDHLYGTNYADKRLMCIEFATGNLVWGQEGFGNCSLTIADGKLLIMSDIGELVLAEASPAGFRQLSQAQVLGGTCWTIPVLYDKKIYCRNSKGQTVCLDVSPAVATGH